MLNLQKHDRLDVWTYEVAKDPDEIPFDDLIITITFKNGEFKECKYPFRGMYTFEQWKVLSAVAMLIIRIQEEYDKEKKVEDEQKPTG